jgi:heme A synthase
LILVGIVVPAFAAFIAGLLLRNVKRLVMGTILIMVLDSLVGILGVAVGSRPIVHAIDPGYYLVLFVPGLMGVMLGK